VGVGSRFHVLRSRNRFRWYRERLVPFSCFPLPDMFSAVPRDSVPVFMFFAPKLAFDGTVGIGSRFSCFARLVSFSTVQRSLGHVFMLCAPGLFFGGTGGVRSRFHIWRSRTLFWRYRGRGVPFSCFAIPDSFSVVPRASRPVFMFSASSIFSAVPRESGPVLMFFRSRTRFRRYRGVRSRFHVLHARTRFRWYRGRQIPFSCFSLPDMFSAVPRASAPFFMFCAPGLIFGGTEDFGPHFQVLRFQNHFRRCRVRRVPFSYFALPD
jgi:hypothetical protein